jgi:hypothetical protein
MDKKLVQNIDEYRQWAWELYTNSGEQDTIERALGLEPIHDCWDSIENEDGSFTDINEDGSVIPKDTAETVKLNDWVDEIKFPCVFVYAFEKSWDRLSDYEISILDYVSIEDFTVTPE